MPKDDKLIADRMHQALNGPTRPNMPKVNSFMVEDAENEIRRSVQRHYQMQAEISELTTDRDQWRNEALLHKAEIERLNQRLKDVEDHSDELKHSNATLEAHMQTCAQSFVSAFNALRGVKHVKVVMPPALEALEHKGEEDRNE